MKTAIGVLFVVASMAHAAEPTAEIKVDQAGYLPGQPKIALIVSKHPAAVFLVRDAGSGSAVFRGKAAGLVDDLESGDRVQAAAFTGFNKPGKYYLDVPGVGRSWDFAIGPEAFSRAWYLAMRSYYGQRCGIAVDLGPEFPGYSYPACHLEGAYHASSGRTGAQKPQHGWHDAGDYGRYVVNSGITTGTLLWTWEMFGKRVAPVRLNIPESGNGTPDILNEIRWNLDWILSMQDSDGGVWQKQTSERFCGFVMPDKDALVSYIIGAGKAPFKSSCATADFAAVMSIAARAYQPFDRAFSAKCHQAARQAWTWLEKYPNVVFRNPVGVSTGEYGDGNCGDERLWAAAELWRTTREAAYEKYFVTHFGEFRQTLRAVAPEGWANVAPLGLWTYVLGGGKTDAAKTIRQDSAAAADAMVERSRRNGYRIAMTAADYVWGSNGVAANYAMQLLVTNAVTPNPAYVDAAFENLHYLLGRNAFSLSWVTRVGANPYRHPHHRPTGADQNPEPWPGLLSGGPNRARQDPVLTKLPAGTPPAKAYVDDQGSYASNETAINWNAPLVFALAATLPEK